jgi:chromosomal replication initiator protein
VADHWDYEAFWNEARDRIQDTLTRQEYDTWFTNMTYHNSQEGVIELAVPSSFYRDQVKQRFQPALEQALFELSARRLKLAYVVRSVAQPAAALSTAPAPATAAAAIAPAPLEAVEAPRRHSQLNPDYTFDRMVEGEGNTFALNAAIAIAKNPGRAYNPCLVYGGVGLGKTHLLQAIGNAVHGAIPDLKVVYVTVETFTNEFIQSIKEKTGHRFKNRYRSADVLLIDDVQFLQGKVETQQELFHTFNALYDANKQMVFTSDRPVSELMNLPDRLINRFERGLNVDLQPPTYETRIAIVTQKIEERGLSLDHSIVELICRNIRSNVRDLEKSLTKLAAYTELMQRAITPPIAQRELQEFFAKPEHLSITIDGIQRVVADYFSLTPADLKGKKRTKAIAFPRQVAMYVSRSLTNCSTTEVGLEFGGRDHTTVMHACQRISERIKTDATLEPTLQKIMNSLRQKSVA